MPNKEHRERLIKAGRCAMCGVGIDNKMICDKCSEMGRNITKQKRLDRIKNNLCTKCGKNKPPHNKKICLACRDKYFDWLNDKGLEYQTRIKKKNLQQRSDRKYRVIHHYGGKCLCCDETDIRFLTIDHVDENGSEHRKRIFPNTKGRPPGGDNFYRWLEKNSLPLGLQTLCYNCNIGKHLNDGICPHQDG